MEITAYIKNKEKSLYQIELPINYNTTDKIEQKLFHVKENKDSIKCKAHYMSGFCLLHETINLKSPQTINFKIKGEHIIIEAYQKGKHSIINNLGKDEKTEGQTGIISRCFQNYTDIDILITEQEEFNRYLFIVSKDYVKELLHNEIWITKDKFFKNVFNTNTKNINTESFFIDILTKNIIQDITKKSYPEAYIRPFLELKLKELLFILHTQKAISYTSTYIPDDVYCKLIMAKAFLMSHFIEPPTIKQLARIISLNEFKLKRFFNEAFNTTIHNFIIKLRMEEAQKILLEDCSISEISVRIGYKSVSHFIDTFKRYYGVTPKQAIKNNKILEVSKKAS